MEDNMRWDMQSYCRWEDLMHDILIWHNLLETGLLRNKNMDFCVLILSVYFNDNFLKIDSYSDKISHHIF